MLTRKNIISWCLDLPGAYEDYPFDSEWTAMRHYGNRKCFAFIYQREGKLRLNVKCEPMEADFFRSAYKQVTPAYHMNKNHWNTVEIGGDVPDDEVLSMIRKSYHLTRPVRAQKSQSL